MIAVADTGPLNYLVLIGHAEVLSSLFTAVVIPETVATELTSFQAPQAVRVWFENRPLWLNIAPDPPIDPTLKLLDPGERSAIALASSINASELVIDDFAGRTEAERRGLKVIGTLGILLKAHRLGLADFEGAVSQIAATSFYLSPKLLDRMRRLLDDHGD